MSVKGANRGLRARIHADRRRRFQPLRQAAVDLHFLQMRSPAQSLGNGCPHIRHFLILRSILRSAFGFL